jgi:DnaJ-class molecular chaperone
MTHYQTLGVAENASQDDIKKAYRKLAMQHHPDRNNGDDTKFKEIQIAYDAVGDEQKRQQYDMQRQNPGGIRFNINDGQHPDIEEMLRNFGFGFSRRGQDPFAHMRRQTRKNQDLKVEVMVPLSSTLGAQKKTISIQNTTGKRDSVEINIPRGVRPNSTIKYPGLGDNHYGDLPRGDLYITVRINNDTDFQLHNLDLIKIIDIDAFDAIIGSKVTINRIDNKTFEMTIPAGTQQGRKFKITGQGLYAMNQNSRGNLMCIVNVIIPTNLTLEQIETIRSIKNKH